jgi:hypothetical protein
MVKSFLKTKTKLFNILKKKNGFSFAQKPTTLTLPNDQ